MANTYKNIVITPNTGAGSVNSEPTIRFSGASQTNNVDMYIKIYSGASGNGWIEFENNVGATLINIASDLATTNALDIPDGDVNAANHFGRFYFGNGAYLQGVATSGGTQPVGNTTAPGSTYTLRSTRTNLNFVDGTGVDIYVDDDSAGDRANITIGATDIYNRANLSNNMANTCCIQYVIDGGGAAITVGEKGLLEVPFTALVTRWTLIGDQSGTANIDLRTTTYSATVAPTPGDTMTANLGLVLSSAKANQGTNLAGWKMTKINAGNVISYNVISAATVTRATISLYCQRF